MNKIINPINKLGVKFGMQNELYHITNPYSGKRIKLERLRNDEDNNSIILKVRKNYFSEENDCKNKEK